MSQGSHEIKIVEFTLLSWGVIFIFSGIALKKITLIPGKIQNILELILEFIYDLADSTIGEKELARPYYPLFVSIFLFILMANLLGLIPGAIAPTANINTTLALALVVFVYYHFLAFKTKGWHYIASFFGQIKVSTMPVFLKPPMAVFSYLILPVIEILSHLTRPVSLSLRLFGNMFAKETLLVILPVLICQFIQFPNLLLKTLLTSMPVLLAPLIILLGVLISFIQASVFLFLTIIYITGAIKSEEH